MAIGLIGYARLAIYAVGKAPVVWSEILSYVILGPKPGQEESDFRTVAFIAALKSATNDGDQITVENLQALTTREYPCFWHTWGIQVRWDIKDPVDIEDHINQAVEKTCPKTIDHSDLPKAKYAPGIAEWEAPRKFKGTISDLSAQEKYNLMYEECVDKDIVILFLHGGAHYLGNEVGHRSIVRKIARKCGGRALSVRYRLSPQNPFPSSLTDALSAYEYLVNPPKGALHRPVDPSKIVIAGDSAGGNLALALSAVLIESQPRWKLPAGMALLSPWCDLTHSMPSCRYAPNDYLPEMHGELKTHKASEAWAADGKQRQFYCQDVMLLHPLVSPILYEGWKPMKSALVHTGAEERLRDEGRFMAQNMIQLGMDVQYEEFKSMPHVFQALLHTPFSHVSLTAIGNYIKTVTKGQKVAPRRFMRDVVGAEIMFQPGQLQEYVQSSILDGMIMARDYFGKPWPTTKSVL